MTNIGQNCEDSRCLLRGDKNLGCNGVGKPAIESDLPFSSRERLDVSHFDGSNAVLLEELLLVLCILLHNVHVDAWGAVQHLVAPEHALVLPQLLEIVVVKFVGSREVQVLGHQVEGGVGTRQLQSRSEGGVDVLVCQMGMNDHTSRSSECMGA